MSKRQADQPDIREQSKVSSFEARYGKEEKNEMGEFEDNWEDEIEEEEVIEQQEEEEQDGKGKKKSIYIYIN